MKTWSKNSVYNVAEEFNRIESFNEYCKTWCKYFNPFFNPRRFTIKTDWNINDIPDINDIIRIKSNINTITQELKTGNNLDTTLVNNISFDYLKANVIELKLEDNQKALGNLQFKNEITGLAICGNTNRLGGVE